MPLYLFYTMVQKSQKWPKTQIKGGPALKQHLKCVTPYLLPFEYKWKVPKSLGKLIFLYNLIWLQPAAKHCWSTAPRMGQRPGELVEAPFTQSEYSLTFSLSSFTDQELDV